MTRKFQHLITPRHTLSTANGVVLMLRQLDMRPDSAMDCWQFSIFLCTHKYKD
jgi:hypothetical protein